MRKICLSLAVVFILILVTTYSYAQETATLTIRSQYGTPDPTVGTHTYTLNTVITASVATPVAGSPGIRYLCTGWRARGSPDTLPAEGTNSTITFQITMNTTLTWRWKTQYQLTTTVSPVGSGAIDVSPTSPDGWYDAKSTVVLTAIDNEGRDFSYWTGGLRGTTNPQNLLLRGPRTVTGNYIREKRYFTVNPPPPGPPVEPSPSVGTHEFYYGDPVTADCGGYTPYPGGEGIQYVCTHLGTGDVTDGPETSISFIIYHDSSVTWLWQKQYYLTIVGGYNPQGEGWYDAGSTAHWSVSPFPGEPGVRYVADPSSGDVLMDSPKTVTISYSITQYYLTLEPPDIGNPQGAGWYDAGTTPHWSVTSPWPEGAVGTRYVATPPTSGDVLMDSPKTVTVTWTTQYYLTVVSGYGAPTGAGWYDAGATAHWSVTSPWPGDPGVRYVAGPASGSVLMDAPETVSVSWTTQYYLTVVSAYGAPAGEGWYYAGGTATWSVTSPWPVEPGVRYVTSPTSGDVLMDEPKTVTVSWTTQYYLTVSVLPVFPVIGGTVAPGSTWYDAGAVVDEAATPNTGFAFSSWSGDPVINPDEPETPETVQITMDAPKSITANFSVNVPRVVTVSSPYGEPNPPVGATTYPDGYSSVTLSCGTTPFAGPAGTRYACTGYTGGSGDITPSEDTATSYGPFTITQDCAITWTWQTQYYLTIVSDYGDPQGAGWYNKDSTAHWSVTSPWPGGSGVQYATDPDSGSEVMDAPKTVTISWTTEYYLTVDSAYGDPQGEGWYGADDTAIWDVTSPWPPEATETRYVADPASGSVVMDAPKTVIVSWTRQYYLRIDSPYGNPQGEGWYNEGSTAHWSVTSPYPGEPGVQYVATPSTEGDIVMSKQVTVTVLWTTQCYLTVSSAYDTPLGAGWYNAGATAASSVTLPVEGPPNIRYRCTGYTGTGSCPSGTELSVLFTITEPSSVTWNWINQYTLTVSVSPEGSGTVGRSPDNTWYDSGTTVWLTANANPGYGFGNWTGDLSAGENPKNLTMNGPKNVTANFLFADFTATPTVGNVPLTVEFTDASGGAIITSWSWNFGAGASPATANRQGPHSVTYSTVGLKTVSLTVTGSGGSDNETKVNYINVLPPVPVAGFSATPRSGVAAPLTVQFTDESTGIVTSREWDFDNNGTVDSTGQNPSCTYTGTGRYTVKLTVTGPGGSDDEIKTGYIRVCIGTKYVSTTGSDSNDGSSWVLAKKTIQAGINAASDDLAVVVAQGTYNIAGDYNIDFGGKAIHLKGTFFEGFESGNITANGWTTGSPAWTAVTTDTPHSGTYHARSGAPSYSGNSYIQRTFEIRAGGGTVTFWWKTNTTDTGDGLRFYIDTTVKETTRSTSWASATYSLDAGTRTLKWEAYRGASPAPSIYGYIDDIEVTNASGCIIDCPGSGSTLRRGFYFHSSETALSVVDGFKIMYGYSDNGGGGAIVCYSTSPTITNCTITSSESTSCGGGIYFYGSSSEVRNCTITNNTAADNGGGICVDYSSGVKIIGCTIQGNTATNSAGAGIYSFESTPKITNCTITGNSTIYWGAGIYCENSSATITDCAITNNTQSDSGGGIFFYGSSSLISNCTITGNSAAYWGGGIVCESSTPTISNCIISGNTSSDAGGGIYCYTASPTIINCTITGNSTTYWGGGIELDLICNPTITNCVIANNTAANGAGIDLYTACVPIITNCTIANNSASTNGGGIYAKCGSSPYFNNTIIWDNSAASGRQIYTGNSGCTVRLNYCDYADNTLNSNNIAGVGTVMPSNCIVSDPLFVNAGGGNYRLLITSPCIDIGNNSYVPAGVTTDLAGNPRIVDGNGDSTATVDIGAYEYQPQ
jgi:parallel beta-helix repeat protein